MTFNTIKELFAKPVDRPIDGVIKADDERHLQVELDEYVVTREVSKGLGSLDLGVLWFGQVAPAEDALADAR